MINPFTIFSNICDILFGKRVSGAIRTLRDTLASAKQDKKNIDLTILLLSDLEKDILDAVHTKGYYILQDFLDKDTCAQLIDEVKDVFHEHEKYLYYADDIRLNGIDTVSNKISQLTKQDIFSNIAQAYCPQHFSWVMANILQFKHGKKSCSGGGLHRDGGFRELKFMIYLSDVNEKNGCFELLEKSHRPWYKFLDTLRFNLPYNNSRYENEYSNISQALKHRFKKIIGKAGTMIIFDTSLMHTGAEILEGERFALTFYFARRGFISIAAIDEFIDKNAAGSKGLVINKELLKQRLVQQLKDNTVIMGIDNI